MTVSFRLLSFFLEHIICSVEKKFSYLTTRFEKTTVHCSMLAEDAIKSAISNYYTKNPKSRTTNLSNTSASLPPKVDAAVDAADAPPPPAAQEQTALA